MSLSSLFVFASAYFAVLILPGPGVTAILARVLARGPKGSSAYIAGFVCGALIWFTIAATGLALVASVFTTFCLAIRYAGAAYLFYLAWRLWNAPANSTAAADSSPDSKWRLFLTGMAINLGKSR
jgi:threonine/homoserine/homoserine lactone efflux protein